MFKIADEGAAVVIRLVADNQVGTFELHAHEERALVVGSTATADFPVSGPGVAPVQFHLERHAGAVWLIPGYAVRELLLNAAHVHGPAPLAEHNVLEFAGVHLVATIHDASAFASTGESVTPRRDNRREFPASYSLELPSEAQATCQAMVPVASRGAANELPTAVHAPFVLAGEMADTSIRNGDLGLATQRYLPINADEIVSSVPAFTPHGTQIIPRYIASPAWAAHDDEITLVTGGLQLSNASAKPVVDVPIETVQLVRLSNAPRPQTAPPRPTPRNPPAHPMLPAQNEPCQLEKRRPSAAPGVEFNSSGSATSNATGAPPVTSPSVGAQRQWIVGRLGALARRRPLMVISAASLGALALMGVLLAADRLARARPSVTRANGPISASLSSLQPATTALMTKPAWTAVSVTTGGSVLEGTRSQSVPNEVAPMASSSRVSPRQRRAAECACVSATTPPSRDKSIY